MSREDTLIRWSQRPSDTEQDRIERTSRMIYQAISNSPDSRLKNAKIFAKGSVKMRTNIRATSDIDLCVQAHGVFFSDYPEGTNRSTFHNTAADYTFSEFRNAVEQALCNSFGSANVDTTGNKAIRVHGTVSGSRIDADVVPAFEHRRYQSAGSDSYISGIELRTKAHTEKRIVNWPHHNYDNSLHKHNETGRRYRKMIRIVKRMKEAMRDAGYQSPDHAPSFLIESLLWNVPSDFYANPAYTDDLTNIFNYLNSMLDVDNRTKEWGEVNELKYLFNPHQKWSRAGAEMFVNDAGHFFRSMT